jgi:hypothetical protein
MLTIFLNVIQSEPISIQDSNVILASFLENNRIQLFFYILIKDKTSQNIIKKTIIIRISSFTPSSFEFHLKQSRNELNLHSVVFENDK